MSLSTTSSGETTRCPSCGAMTRAAADWCGLCWADLRPAPPEPEPSTPDEALLVDAESAVRPTLDVPAWRVPDPLTDPLDADGTPVEARPTWPCSTCDELVDLELSACPGCGSGFLALETGAVAGGGLTRLLALGRGQRLAIGFGAAVLLSGLCLGVLALLGALL